MAKITEEDLTEFLEEKITRLQTKLLKARKVLETLKETHKVADVKLKKKELNSIKNDRSDKRKKGKKKTSSTIISIAEEQS